jgi:hypothetical protein
MIAASASGADFGGIYLGGGLGGAHYDIDYSSQVRSAYDGSPFTVQSAAMDRRSDFAYKAFIGYPFVPQFAAELSYVDLGQPKAHYDLTSTLGLYTRSASYRIRGANLAGVGIVPVTDALSLHGMLGVFYSRLEYSESGTNAPGGEPYAFSAPNRWRADLSFGLGAAYRLHERWSIRGDWDRFRNIGAPFNLTTSAKTADSRTSTCSRSG